MSDAVAQGKLISGDSGTEQTAPVWQSAVDRARHALAENNHTALIALNDELAALMERPRAELRRGLPQLRLYRSLIIWKRDQQFVAPFDDAQTAKIQFWDLDEHCSDLDYKRAFADATVGRYPERRGFRLFQRVLKTISNSELYLHLDDADVHIHRRPGATMTIIGFGGVKGGFAGIGWDLFERAVVAPLNANLIVLRDYTKRLYLGGIESLGNYQESVEKLRAILAEFSSTKIVASGASAGVFGAINFSADLGVRHIVAFAGPTSVQVGLEDFDRQIYRRITEDMEAGLLQQVDLADKVNNSAIDRIDFFVSGKHKFDRAQLEALASRCDKVQPHIYEDLNEHVITDYTIEDGSVFAAFRAGPETKGLA